MTKHMYEELIKRLRECTAEQNGEKTLWWQAADAIEELLKFASGFIDAAKAMHTWIFLHTGDEQAAYDECGLSDEMNAMLGYGGQFVAELPKEEA